MDPELNPRVVKFNIACHNCRRRRLRCDHSRPGCLKCAVSGQVCLGYDRLLIWTKCQGGRGGRETRPNRRLSTQINLDGAMSGAASTINDMEPGLVLSVDRSLTDPNLAPLDQSSRYYLAHCEWAMNQQI